MDWNRRPLFGVGINDVKEYTRGTKAYLVWKSMLSRCYSGYTQSTNPAYVGCSVCEEWLTFSKFKEWFEQNYIPGNQLDKDILEPGNRVYSPDTCCFVPKKLNAIFSGHARQTDGATGVRKQYRKYVSAFRADGTRYAASFDTLKEAEEFYNNHRKNHIRKVANEFFADGRIKENVYNKLLSYAV